MFVRITNVVNTALIQKNNKKQNFCGIYIVLVKFMSDRIVITYFFQALVSKNACLGGPSVKGM